VPIIFKRLAIKKQDRATKIYLKMLRMVYLVK